MRKRTAVAVVAVLTLAATLPPSSCALTAPIEIALVESFTGKPPGVAVMAYLEAGQTILLRPEETLVLTYLHSCVRETITGGTVTIGKDQSEVQAGTVKRTLLDCQDRKFVLTGSPEIAAGRVFRGARQKPTYAGVSR